MGVVCQLRGDIKRIMKKCIGYVLADATFLQICSMRDLHPNVTTCNPDILKSAVYCSAGICMFTSFCVVHSRGENEIVYRHKFSPMTAPAQKKEKCIKKPQMNATLIHCHGNTRRRQGRLCKSAKLEQFKIYDQSRASTKGTFKC